jgi:hypothetical protein
MENLRIIYNVHNIMEYIPLEFFKPCFMPVLHMLTRMFSNRFNRLIFV